MEYLTKLFASFYFKVYVGVIIACVILSGISEAMSNVDKFKRNNKDKPYTYFVKAQCTHQGVEKSMLRGFVTGIFSPIICVIIIPYIISLTIAYIYDGSEKNPEKKKY